ncbi:hypothetical protein DY000_02032555 [Brassica cretica]|uniref:Uncharacterized protein n=1 Tax=Brassica cretica TaxID=69181 RepID=A0ABQ7DDF4_BRACR|nr:hypothetical protein DY000_02032555 [Brassica cretica]
MWTEWSGQNRGEYAERAGSGNRGGMQVDGSSKPYVESQRTVLQTGADTWGTSWLGSAGEPMLHKTSSAVK